MHPGRDRRRHATTPTRGSDKTLEAETHQKPFVENNCLCHTTITP
jgi:hypothetical protein